MSEQDPHLQPEPTAPDLAQRPLAGIRVIEIGQLLAGPFTGMLLAYFGAEVIKIEPPQGGDPIRGWREVDTSADGTIRLTGGAVWHAIRNALLWT